jgi:hypothetical protein
VDAGHRAKLYLYEAVGGVPEGAEIANASEVLPTAEFIYNAQTRMPGPHADRFRYHLLD